MPSAQTSDSVTIEYDTFGAADDPALLLVMGFTAQMTAWRDDFCKLLADRGLFVIRFDNRDCGLSTKFDGASLDMTRADAGDHHRPAVQPTRRTRSATWPPTGSACSTTSASSGPTCSARRWAG